MPSNLNHKKKIKRMRSRQDMLAQNNINPHKKNYIKLHSKPENNHKTTLQQEFKQKQEETDGSKMYPS